MTTESFIRERYPFRVAATSFLIPADWETNVRAVGHLVDEIELLFLDSRPPGSIPTGSTIEALAALSSETGVSYNIHLPGDLSPAHPDRGARTEAAAVLDNLIRLTSHLDPSAYTLHLPYDAPDRRLATVRSWQARACDFVSALLDTASDCLTPATLTIENLTDCPPSWVWDAVSSLGVGFCLDVGHLMLQGGEIGQVFADYGENIPLIHLHGVDGSRDHLPLTVLAGQRAYEVTGILEAFHGTVAVEVFNRAQFWASIAWLDNTMAPR